MAKQPVKVVILCGGKGIRLSAYSDNIPKPLVRIGDMPIIWHVMKLYSHFGFKDFILTLGHQADKFVDFFIHYKERNCDYTMGMMPESEHRFHTLLPEDEREWNITFVHTGEDTSTGGRIKRIAPYIAEDRFLATYADGLSDVNLANVLQHHDASGMEMTMVTVNLSSPFGIVESYDGRAKNFREKPQSDIRINGGFFVCNKSVFDYLDDDETVFEGPPLERLADEGKLGVYEHNGFWQCMDTPKDYIALNKLWTLPTPPWKV